MQSWTNATRPPRDLPGVLRPALTRSQAGLRREYPLHPALAPFVERYWSVHWGHLHPGGPPHRCEVLAQPCVNLTVESGDRPRHGVPLPATLLHGLTTRRFSIDLDGWGRCTAVKFRPGGFTALTGRSVARDTVRPFAALPGLMDDVLGVAADDDRVAVLDAALAALATEPDATYVCLTDLVTAMATTRALTRVDQVAELAGCSTRALQRMFRRFVGVGPKWLLARYRVQDAVAAIDVGGADLAALAADLGWFDQAHFSRDFRASVGVTPSAYLAAARAAR